jgi:flagellar hook protein FlgE
VIENPATQFAQVPMSYLSAISQSGMRAAQTALDASAHNIANLATRDFRRAQVAQASASSGGVTTSLTQASERGNTIEADMVGQMVAKNAFLANLAVFRTGDKMLGAFLDAKS